MCGIIGIIDKQEEVFDLAVIGLMSLQHRGQDACGLLTADKGELHLKKSLGPVHKVFSNEDAALLPGRMAIGHTRYATQGKPRVEEAQPLQKGKIGLALNGNIVNYFSQKRKLEEAGTTFETTVDTELLLHYLTKSYEEKEDFFVAAEHLLNTAKGAYALVGVIEGVGLFGIRDPKGIRPLVLGKNGTSYLLASESVALQAVGAEYVRDIEPGEAIIISPELTIKQRVLKKEAPAHCMFEWVYFASPNSMIEQRSVYKARLALGHLTGKRVYTEDVDVVTPVPNSGRTAAIKLAESQHIRYREGLIRDRRTARTFIMASQKAREKAVGQKLRPIIATVAGKSVVVVDDSIVRGTTSKTIVKSLRRAGAEEVTFVSTCPPIRYPCHYGIDFSSNEELVAHGRNIREIKECIEADELVYATIEDLQRALKRRLCTACLTGDYPVPVEQEEQEAMKEQRATIQGELDGKMDVLLLGGGGREHALALKLAESNHLGKLYAAPGNPGIAAVAECHTLDLKNNEAVVAFAKEKKVGLVVVGPEEPLANGIVDALEAAGIAAFGPGKAAARFEGSKSFSRKFMEKYDLPSCTYKEFTKKEAAHSYIKAQGAPIVIKADGLAAGKGVLVAENIEEAIAFADECLDGEKFGKAGAKIIVEEFLEGEEASYLLFTDGKSFRPMPFSQDHKQAYEGDKGPNTGGMGAYSPAPLLTGFKEELEERIVKPFLKGCEVEGIDYRGVLYVGLMKTKTGLRILEFNCRFGDPETQVLLPRLESDLIDIMLAVAERRLGEVKPEWKREQCATIVLASAGYPGSYEKGKEIEGIEKVEGVTVIHAGTKKEGEKLLTNGGRVLNVVALGATLQEAISKAYKEITKITFPGIYYRKDIAWKELQRDA